MAYLTFTPLVIIVSFLTLIVFRRDLETIFFFGGCVLNALICSIVKKIIRQPRPEGSNKSGFGMPSNHAQFMFFFAAYIYLLVSTGRWKFSKKSSGTLLQVSVFLLSIFVAISRYHLGVHSLAQLLVGAFIGILFANMWQWVAMYVIRPLYPLIERWSVSKYLYIRDIGSIDNSLLFEYNAYKTAKAKK